MLGMGGVVIQGDGNQRSRLGHHLPNILPLRVGHPGHVGLVALVASHSCKATWTGLFCWGGIGDRGNPDPMKSEGDRLGFDLCSGGVISPRGCKT
jgi:hypothetical protein